MKTARAHIIIVQKEGLKMLETQDRFGRKFYPMSAEEEKIYNRLIKEYPQEKQIIYMERLEKPENRDWANLEEAIKYF